MKRMEESFDTRTRFVCLLAQVNTYELMFISYECYLIQIWPDNISTLVLIDANWLKQIWIWPKGYLFALETFY
jgi:hypothetical protein